MYHPASDSNCKGKCVIMPLIQTTEVNVSPYLRFRLQSAKLYSDYRGKCMTMPLIQTTELNASPDLDKGVKCIIEYWLQK